MTKEDRFWAKVDKSGDCWTWTACLGRRGYGLFLGEKLEPAHRWIWRHINGPIPDGHVIMHKCDNPSCVRPDHLQAGTQSENIRDCVAKGRHVDARGERCPTAKLNDFQARVIKRLRGRLTGRDTARIFGVSEQAICNIHNGRNFAHV